jgi:hypothetical protein
MRRTAQTQRGARRCSRSRRVRCGSSPPSLYACGVLSMWCGVLSMWCGVLFMWCGVLSMWCGVLSMWCGVLSMWCGVLFMWCGVGSLPDRCARAETTVVERGAQPRPGCPPRAWACCLWTAASRCREWRWRRCRSRTCDGPHSSLTCSTCPLWPHRRTRRGRFPARRNRFPCQRKPPRTSLTPFRNPTNMPPTGPRPPLRTLRLHRCACHTG